MDDAFHENLPVMLCCALNTPSSSQHATPRRVAWHLCPVTRRYYLFRAKQAAGYGEKMPRRPSAPFTRSLNAGVTGYAARQHKLFVKETRIGASSAVLPCATCSAAGFFFYARLAFFWFGQALF